MVPPVQTLLEKMKYYSEEDRTLTRKAYTFAEAAHEGQLRVSGAPYFVHPVGVAAVVADMHLPAAMIAAALLHDVLEDTPLPRAKLGKELREAFGDDIVTLVERITKLSPVRYYGMSRYLENLRKMFIAMGEDLRAIVLKFADRLNNLTDLEVLPERKRTRVALETIELYAPIANRLGMGDIKGRLEDAAFPHAFPKEYAWTKALIADELELKELQLEEAQTIVKNLLEHSGIAYHAIDGRTKRLFSLYQKLIHKNRDLSQIYDLVALRIIVEDVADCYAVLGEIHTRFKPLKGRIKDYIAQPKPNGYQSLHTTVFSDDGAVIEMQIRTNTMHEEAEYGVAAHWRYDEAAGGSAIKPKKIQWIQELVRVQKALHDKKILLETLGELKLDVFRNRIFVFTPKGDVLDLPEDSTPVDFAYAIHTDIGDHCINARINNEFKPLDTALESGDVVEVVTDKNRRGPAAEWLKFAKTRHARQKIKAHRRNHLTDWMKDIFPNRKKEQGTGIKK